MYHAIVKRLVRKSFTLVNERRFDELAKGMATDVRHSFAGDHALGGVRHDVAALKAWLQRVARLVPNLYITITDIQVKGLPHHTLAIARWTARATLLNGDAYVNKGVHLITLKWGKAIELDVYEDTKAVSDGLDKQFAWGITEAKAAQIIS